VEPGSCVITDGWSAYPKTTRNRYTHRGTSVAASGLQAHEVQRSTECSHSSNAGSWAPCKARLARSTFKHIDEWVFRLNWRNSRSRGLLFYRVLELAVGHSRCN
jgi:hypothetical protein